MKKIVFILSLFFASLATNAQLFRLNGFPGWDVDGLHIRKRLDPPRGDPSLFSPTYFGIMINSTTGRLMLSNGTAWSDVSPDLAPYLLSSTAASTYLTISAAAGAYQPLGSYITTETDPTVSSVIKAIPVTTDATTNKFYYWNNGSIARKQIPYSDISGTPTLVSSLTNDAGYLTSFTETDPVYTANGVPKTRTLTINGTSHDLTADDSWTIATAPAYKEVIVTADYTVASDVSHVVVNSSFGGQTITLPSASANTGRKIDVSYYGTSGSTITISPAFVYDQLGSTASAQMAQTAASFISDGTSWFRSLRSFTQRLMDQPSSTGSSLIPGGEVSTFQNGNVAFYLKKLQAGTGVTLSTGANSEIVINASGTSLSGTGYVKMSGSTPSYQTPTQVTADLNLFTTALKGLTPPPVSSTGKFLRDDATWVELPSYQNPTPAYSGSDVWVAQTGNTGVAICWSPALSLFVEVGNNSVYTSPTGVTWTSRTPAQANFWTGVTWSPELSLFVAVSVTGTSRVMTSPDGITWTSRTAAAANSWNAVTWSPELSLFCAVSSDGTNRIMTSPDGITWTGRSAPAVKQWYSIAYSPQLRRFSAIAVDATLNTMYSNDGITWASGNTINSGIGSVYCMAWSPQLGIFCAVSSYTAAPTTATSSDGITWVTRSTAAAANANFYGMAWSPELGIFAAVGNSGSRYAIITSPDGVNWTAGEDPATGAQYYAIAWSPSLNIFAAIANNITTGSAIMTSPTTLLSTAKTGTATLTAGTKTVTTTAIKTGAKVFLTVNTPSGTQGFLSAPIASFVNGASFVINSSSATETSTVNWQIVY